MEWSMTRALKAFLAPFSGGEAPYTHFGFTGNTQCLAESHSRDFSLAPGEMLSRLSSVSLVISFWWLFEYSSLGWCTGLLLSSLPLGLMLADIKHHMPDMLQLCLALRASQVVRVQIMLCWDNVHSSDSSTEHSFLFATPSTCLEVTAYQPGLFTDARGEKKPSTHKFLC